MALVDKCIKKFLNDRHEPPAKTNSANSTSKDFYISLPFFGHPSEKMKNELLKLLKNAYENVNFKIVLVNPLRISSYFNYKDRIPKNMKASLVYQFKCGCVQDGTPVSYVGSTKRHLYERICEHAGISSRTGNRLEVPPFSAIREHCQHNNCKIELSNFSIIGCCRSETELRILESLHINNSRPVLNNMNSSFQLSIV